jgi:curved DNA-binding protein CbpA
LATYYEILGVDKDASCESIKKAYRDKAKRLHPDINSAAAAKSSFQKINEAYQVLSDEQKRRLYDMQLNIEAPRVIIYRNGYPRYRQGARYTYYRDFYHQHEESSTKFEKIFDQFLFFFMLGAGLCAVFFGVARLWAEPIEGVNPMVGIVFGTLFTVLLVWGWLARRSKK